MPRSRHHILNHPETMSRTCDTRLEVADDPSHRRPSREGRVQRRARRHATRSVMIALACTVSCAEREPPSTTVAIVNARVWTGDSTAPWAEAISVAGDSIVAVGTTAAVRATTSQNTRLIDAKGAMVTPGLVDAHVHFLLGGFALASVQLRDAATKAEFIRRIAAFAKTAPKGTWIRNGDWDHTNWEGAELPTHAWIDSVTPNNPVWINRLDGHMSLANTLAMNAARITRTARDIAGGSIVRDAAGNPTGIFKDNAMSLIDAVMPPRSAAEEDRALDSAMSYVAARGVTAVHDMGDFGDIAAFRRAHDAKRLRTRIVAQVPLSRWAALRDTVAARGRGDEWLAIGGLKGFADGSLGSHTAAMLQPFTDAPSDRGLLVTPADSLYAWTKAADSAGLQVMVHAIGDRAIRTQLDIFARVARENGVRDRRFRLEHAQHIAPEDFARFAAIPVVASMQPYHAIDDGRWAERVIGPTRAAGSYAWKSLLDAHATLAFGSDWFVAPPTPLEGIYAAVTRQTLDGKQPNGWVPAQRISVEQALRAYTYGAAYAGFQERRIGTLRPGMLADLVLLDRDLTAVSADSIRSARVRATMVGGRFVFEER